MNTPKQRRVNPRALCAEWHPDDGVDPRDLAADASANRSRQTDHKLRQLCKQAARSLSAALAGDCADARLQELEVIAVRPAPNAGRLCVVLRPAGRLDRAEHAALERRLAGVAGFLRSRLAADIARKRVPQLVFDISEAPNER